MKLKWMGMIESDRRNLRTPMLGFGKVLESLASLGKVNYLKHQKYYTTFCRQFQYMVCLIRKAFTEGLNLLLHFK